jgi:hypothetical protein
MALEHDERPWGNYTVLDEGADYKVKRITVHAGKRLSYQRHARREEHCSSSTEPAASRWKGKSSTSPPERPLTSP